MLLSFVIVFFLLFNPILQRMILNRTTDDDRLKRPWRQSQNITVCRKRRAIHKWIHIFLLPLFLWNDISYLYPWIKVHNGLLPNDIPTGGSIFSFFFVQASSSSSEVLNEPEDVSTINQTLSDEDEMDKKNPTTHSQQQSYQKGHVSNARIRSRPSFRRGLAGATTITTEQQNALSSSTTKQSPTSPLTITQILKRAGKSGLGGGISGAIAGFIQVFTLMWLRTVVNYQCRYGTTFRQALITLYQQGGITRFYRGLSFALIQAPLARFVSTAANDGVETLVASLEATRHWGPGRTTIVASIVVGIWRMILMPIDTCKTVLQVDSVEGFRNLMRKVKAGKIDVLYQGASANALSAILGHYPWFYTYTFMSNNEFLKNVLPSKLLRHASIGFVASIISDTIVNAFRVVKTTKQSLGAKHAAVSYGEVVAMILAADGWKGLFGRGLGTRYLTNAVQSIVFTIIWRGLAERFTHNEGGANTRRELSIHDGENVDEGMEDKF